MVWSECKTTGSKGDSVPGPRGYHTATLLENNRILVFGGSDGQECFSDLHILDTGHGTNLFPGVILTIPQDRTFGQR